MAIPGLTVMRAGTLEPATLAYQGNSNSVTNSASYTFTSRAIGAESSDRRVIVAWTAFAESGRSLTSLTIGGIAATLVYSNSIALPSPNTQRLYVGFAVAVVPTGTTATIALTFSASVYSCAFGWWSATKLTSSTPSATASHTLATSGTHSLSVAVPAGGIVIAQEVLWDTSGVLTRTWTGLTERYDTTAGAENNVYSGASDAFSAAQTVSITVTNPSAADSIAVAAAWR